MNVRTLVFDHFGKTYHVDEMGRIAVVSGSHYHSPQWLFLGGSRHHRRNGLDVTLQDAFRDPASLNGCIGWDRDHGTMRRWGGRYYGRTPRITSARVEYAREEVVL